MPYRAAVIVAPLLAGWAVATWAALTMHGYWWPGRQVVVVLPLAALAVLWWLAHMVPRLRPVAFVLGLLGVGHLAALLADGWSREITWVVGFEHVDDPLYRALRPVFPDYRADGPAFWLLHVAWVAVILVLLYAGLRTARGRRLPDVDRPRERITVP
jgi:hypothetical protein